MGQEEALPPAPAAAVAFSWEHETLVPNTPISAPAMDAGVGMPESPRKAEDTVNLSWEHEQGMMTKQSVRTRRLSVPPPPGRPSGPRGFSRAVRPEDDPFLAAYLACTKSTGGRGDYGGKKKRTTGAGKGEIRRLAWVGFGGLSCKRGDGAVVQSMMKLPKLPELDARDD